MKILSSFDTNLKKEYIKFYENKYGKDKVFVITRDKLYYFIKVIIRIIYGLISHIWFAILIYILGWYDTMLYYWLTLWGLFWLIFYGIALENYIDYSMNYAIFTPDDAILIEQKWFFKRSIKTLDIKKIKSISNKRSNILFSVFNSWVLNILSEWSERAGEIIFKYVHDPDYAQAEIQRLMIISPHRMEYHNIHSI